MKKLLLSISVILWLTPVATAQKNDKINSINTRLTHVVAQQEAARLQLYYNNPSTAHTCEAWRSCAKWAFEEYQKDQTFKIVKAELKTQRKVYRHRVTNETHLFVEAAYANRTVYVEFTTPQASGRTRPYRYITRFSK